MASSYAPRPQQHDHHLPFGALPIGTVLVVGFVLVWLSMALNAPWSGLLTTS
jgi:hypothetical protein